MAIGLGFLQKENLTGLTPKSNGSINDFVKNYGDKRESLFNSIFDRDKADGLDGKVNGTSIFNNKGLNSDYQAVINAKNSGNDADFNKAKDKFIDSLLSADAEDGEIDGSVISNQEIKKAATPIMKENITKIDLFNKMKSFDESDDGKVNGSIFNNKGFVDYFDIMDDGIKNNSIANYIKSLTNAVGDGYEADGRVKYDQKDATQGYRAFESIDNNGSMSSSLKNDIYPQISGKNHSYNAGDYADSPVTASINPAELGEGTAANAAKIALQQLGANERDGSYLKYSQGRNEAWCADFVNWAFEQALGGKGSLNKAWGYRGAGNYKASVSELRQWGQSQNAYIQKNQTSPQNLKDQVKAGDLIIFSGDSHVGIVTKIDPNGTIHTVEGNTSDAVHERTYNLNNGRIAGFVKMNELEKKGQLKKNGSNLNVAA